MRHVVEDGGNTEKYQWVKKNGAKQKRDIGGVLCREISSYVQTT